MRTSATGSMRMKMHRSKGLLRGTLWLRKGLKGIAGRSGGVPSGNVGRGGAHELAETSSVPREAFLRSMAPSLGMPTGRRVQTKGSMSPVLGNDRRSRWRKEELVTHG